MEVAGKKQRRKQRVEICLSSMAGPDTNKQHPNEWPTGRHQVNLSSRAHKAMIRPSSGCPPFHSTGFGRALTCQQKLKVFFQLLLQHRLNSRNLEKGEKNITSKSYNGVLSTCQTEETLHHLFLTSQFAPWRKPNHPCFLKHLDPWPLLLQQ